MAQRSPSEPALVTERSSAPELGGDLLQTHAADAPSKPSPAPPASSASSAPSASSASSTPPAPPAPSTTPASSAPPAPPALGSDRLHTGGFPAEGEGSWQSEGLLLERFRLQGLLGRGGMGEVWEAFDLQTSGVVALKRLHPALFSHPSAPDRFLREIGSLQRLHHPGIVRVYEFFPEGTFFSMERLDGQTLRAVLLEKKRLPLQDTLRLLLQLTEALQATHKEGIIHRDLKPENLFLCGSPPWTLKLLDFGIVLLAEGTRVTETRAAGIGTAYYMAPEQVEGSTSLTVAVDVYACGALLYEMLTGRIFQGQAPSLSKRYQALATEGSLAPSEGPTDLQATLTDALSDLDRLLREATAYEAHERCSLDAYHAALQRQHTALLRGRKDASEKRWKKAKEALFRTPAPRVLSEIVEPCLAAFPERSEIAAWAQMIREAWDKACAFAASLDVTPSSPLEELAKGWQAFLEAAPGSEACEQHPFWQEIQAEEKRLRAALNESLALAERQGPAKAAQVWSWQGRPSTQIEPWLTTLHEGIQQAEDAARSAEALALPPRLDVLRRAWQEKRKAALFASAFDSHPFAKTIASWEEEAKAFLLRQDEVAKASGPAEALKLVPPGSFTSLAIEEARTKLEIDDARFYEALTQTSDALENKALSERRDKLKTALAAWEAMETKKPHYRPWIRAQKASFEQGLQDETLWAEALQEENDQILEKEGYAEALRSWKERESSVSPDVFRLRKQTLENNDELWAALLADTKDFLQAKKKEQNYKRYTALKERWEAWRKKPVRPADVLRHIESLEKARPSRPWQPFFYVVLFGSLGLLFWLALPLFNLAYWRLSAWWYDDACKKGNREACKNLGHAWVSLAEKPSLEGMWEEAAVLYKRACDAGHTDACVKFHLCTAKQAEREKDWGAASQGYQRACKAGHKDACSRVLPDR